MASHLTAYGAGPLLDPDCRDGKHSSCIGEPCECPCHTGLDAGRAVDIEDDYREESRQ